MRKAEPREQSELIPRRVLAYARVSGQEQGKHGTSLEGQDEDLQRFCRDHGYPKPTIFVEVEGGGVEKEEKRTEQRRLMASVQPGDLVLCCKQDRWSRYTLHFLASTAEITKHNARFFSIAEKFDPSTSEGRFAATIMAAVAEQEHSRIKERTVGTRRRLRLAGAFVEGLPPLGYKVEDRALVVDPVGAAVVKRIFDLSIAGYSTRQIAALVTAEFPGTPGLDNAGIARRLKDRRYLGEVNTIGGKLSGPTGEWVKRHEPIVDRPTWLRAQSASAKRKIGGRPITGSARNITFLLRGVIYCGSCKRVMVAHAPGPTGSTKHGGYYLCRKRTTGPVVGRCNGPFARHEDVDAAFEIDFVAQLERLTDRLSRPPKEAPRSPKKVDYEAERTKLVKRRERLVDAIGEGILSGETARAKVEAVERALIELDDRRASSAAPAPPPLDRTALLEQVIAIRKAWSNMMVDAKREVIGLVLDRAELHSTQAERWQRGAWKLALSWREIN